MFATVGPIPKGFKFKFELFLEISFLVLFATCKRTSIFLIQVSQYKFTVLNIMSRKMFGEFMGFHQKVLTL
jgi:hypothetical protein